jgi:hypothetical protein
MTILTSDKQKEYHEFICRAVDMLSDEKVKSIAIVSITDDDTTITNYWQMCLRDKETAELAIRKDEMTDFINVNRDYFFPSEMDCTEDIE